MTDVKVCFSKNLTKLRKDNMLSQRELAEKINYSDKAISKWERGEAIPDVMVLLELASLFNVTLDYLVKEADENAILATPTNAITKIKKQNRILISAISIIAVLSIFTILFVGFVSASGFELKYFMMFYVFPVPLYFLLLIIFSSIWGGKRSRLIFVSLFVWSIVVILYLSVSTISPFIFLVGVFAEIIILMSFNIIRVKKFLNKK